MKPNQAVQLRNRFTYLNGTVSMPENERVWRVVVGPAGEHALSDFLFQLSSTDSRDVDLLDLFAGEEVDVYVVLRSNGGFLPVKMEDYAQQHRLSTDSRPAG